MYYLGVLGVFLGRYEYRALSSGKVLVEVLMGPRD